MQTLTESRGYETMKHSCRRYWQQQCWGTRVLGTSGEKLRKACCDACRKRFNLYGHQLCSKLDVSQIKRQIEESEEMTCLKSKVWHSRFPGNWVFWRLGWQIKTISPTKLKLLFFQLHNDYYLAIIIHICAFLCI